MEIYIINVPLGLFCFIPCMLLSFVLLLAT